MLQKQGLHGLGRWSSILGGIATAARRDNVLYLIATALAQRLHMILFKFQAAFAAVRALVTERREDSTPLLTGESGRKHGLAGAATMVRKLTEFPVPFGIVDRPRGTSLASLLSFRTAHLSSTFPLALAPFRWIHGIIAVFLYAPPCRPPLFTMFITPLDRPLNNLLSMLLVVPRMIAGGAETPNETTTDFGTLFAQLGYRFCTHNLIITQAVRNGYC